MRVCIYHTATKKMIMIKFYNSYNFSALLINLNNNNLSLITKKKQIQSVQLTAVLVIVQVYAHYASVLLVTLRTHAAVILAIMIQIQQTVQCVR
jgi:hypothetical protein